MTVGPAFRTSWVVPPLVRPRDTYSWGVNENVNRLVKEHWPDSQIALVTSRCRQMERLQNMNSSGAREQLTKALAESELKLSELDTRIEQQDEVIENKLKMVSNSYMLPVRKLYRRVISITRSSRRAARAISVEQNCSSSC